MLKCSASLWSADLANLAAEIKRVEPYTDRFHLDVADGHYVPSMLFFPDLVKALRKHTTKPFEVHLMTTDPAVWVEPFVEAGADGVIFCFDSLSDPAAAIKEVKDLGKFVAISLLVTEPISLLRPYWNTIDQVTIVGTPMGTKGTSMESTIFDKIREARTEIEKHSASVEIQVDGGIRRNTVPQIHQAGADWIVPGSLMFSEDPATMRQWLSTI
ncbi:MAG: ribulose-phosphate 3-epimerase [Isosphaerales bacterium]